MRPDELDPLEAASAPIPPDPIVGAPAPSARGWVVRGNTAREEMIARYVAAGYTPAEAARLVDAELSRSGPRPRAMFDQDNTPEGNAALAQRVQNGRRVEGRQAEFEANYNEATGAPQPPDIMPPQMAPDEVPLTAERLRGMGLNPYAEPPVRMPDGSRLPPPRQLMTEREATEYNIRKPYGVPGQYHASGRDEDNARRGYVPVNNEDGTVVYRLSPSGEVDGLPGTPGRGGRRGDLEAPLLKADGTPVLDQDGHAVRRFRVDTLPGPLSQNNSVYVPSDQTREKNDAYRRERQLYRDARIQGVSPAQLLENSPDDYGDLTAGGQRDRVGARAANEGARLGDERLRTDRWRAQMMLAGQNRAKNQVNAFSMMDEPGVSEDQRQSLQYMLPGGALVAQVDAAAAGQQADRNAPDARLVDAKLAQLDREAREADPAAAGRQDLAAGNVTSPMAQKEADRLALQYDSGDEGPPMMGGWGGMSDADEANLAAALVRDYGMDETLARETARTAADRRRYDRPGTKNGPRGPLPVAPRAPRGGPRPAAAPPVGR
jgi:hypothetical protein